MKRKTEKLIRKKALQVMNAERQYWAKYDHAWKEVIANAELVDFELPDKPDLFSQVFGFRDAAVVVRSARLPGVDYKIVNFDAPVSAWADLVTIPAMSGNGTIHYVTIGKLFGGHGSIVVNCGVVVSDFETVKIPYYQSLRVNYGEQPDIEDAIHDLSITILGAISDDLKNTAPIEQSNVIESLEKLLDEFRQLLVDSSTEDLREEVLQTFLKEHPVILVPNGQAIPKQKLGVEFCTDFVLVDLLDQGRTYTFVEIEKSSHKVFTKSGELRKEVTHAVHQTVEWDVWLQTHSAYLRDKLPQFETPKYLIVIGRSDIFTDDNREILRAYNRRLQNTEVWTYDDVAHSFEERIRALKDHHKVG